MTWKLLARCNSVSRATMENNNDMNKRQKSTVDDEESCAISKLPCDILVEVLSKLPIKSIYVCKCVCKSWRLLVSNIYAYKKGLELPIHGLVFLTVVRPPVGAYPTYHRSKIDVFYNYMSLKDKQIRMRAPAGTCNGPRVAMFDISDNDFDDRKGFLLGSLTLDFNSICEIGRDQNWNIHRGLLLTVPDGRTCHVYNPVTKEVFVVPCSPCVEKEGGRPKILTERRAAIINDLDSALSIECRFRIVRFSLKRRLVEVYYSDTNKWESSEFSLDKTVCSTPWILTNTVFLEETLFFLTCKTQVVVVKFGSASDKRVHVYSVQPPWQVSKKHLGGVLGESQGCLYLSYHRVFNFWIWKYNGSSTTSDVWIPQLIFTQSETLCQPVVHQHLRQFVDNKCLILIVGFHPHSPVVYIDVDSRIYAIHLLNDTVEKLADLEGRDLLMGDLVVPYSPCFGSLEWLKRAHQSLNNI